MDSPAGIDMRRVVQIATVLSQDLGSGALRSGLRGSGYQMSRDTVLTSGHVLTDAVSITVRFVGPGGSSRQFAGHVVFLDEDSDVAVVKVADGEDLDGVRPVAFGRVDQLLHCEAIGFPRFKMRRAVSADGRSVEFRDTRHATGTISPLSNWRDGSLEMRVDPPEHDPDPRRSPWEGMSGAAVWSDRRMIGLVCEHRHADGLSTLTVNPVARWYRCLSQRQLHELRELVGLPDETRRVAAAGPEARKLEAYLLAARNSATQHPYLGPLAGAPPLAAVYLRQVVDRQSAASAALGGLLLRPEDGSGEGERMSATEVLASAGTCVVLAGPGGGKSSLLRTCVDASAGRWLRGFTDAAMPVLVSAVQLMDAPLLDAVAKAVSQELKWFGLTRELTASFFRAPPALDVPWLFLIDGLDEITSPETRQLLLNQLQTIARTPDSGMRFVIATRPLPAGELDVLGPDIPVYELQRFTDSDVLKVATAWFTALGMANPNDMTRRFTAAVARRPRLPELARTPLMAAMLCQLFAAAPEHELPDSRGAIYQEFTSWLFKRLNTPGLSGAWTQADSMFAGYSPQVRQQARQVIAELPVLIGYLAAERRTGNTSHAASLIASQPAAQAPQGPAADEWLGYLDAILRRSGLLAARGDDFVFLHQTLEDYLAAKYVGRNPHDRAAILRKALRFHQFLPTSSPSWPREDPPFLGFLIDPGTEASAEAVHALDHVATAGGLDGCRFLATLVQLGTKLPPDVTRHAAQFLDQVARRRGGKYDRQRIPAARILVGIDRAQGLDLLSWLATWRKYEGHTEDVLREIASLDRARTADVLTALLASPKKRRFSDEQKLPNYARFLLHVDPACGSDAVKALAEDSHLSRDLRIEMARLLAEFGDTRGRELLESMATDSDWRFDHTKVAQTLARIDKTPNADVLEHPVKTEASAIAPFISDTGRVRLVDSRYSDLMDLDRKLRSGELAESPGSLHDSEGELPEELLKLDDPRAGDLLFKIAQDPRKYSYIDPSRYASALGSSSTFRLTAAWRLAQLGDRRAFGILDDVARNHNVAKNDRLIAAEILADLDSERADELRELIANEPKPELTRARKIYMVVGQLFVTLVFLFLGLAIGQRSDTPHLGPGNWLAWPISITGLLLGCTIVLTIGWGYDEEDAAGLTGCLAFANCISTILFGWFIASHLGGAHWGHIVRDWLGWRFGQRFKL